MTFPVAILSFNRPDMLARVLESLVKNRKLADGDVGPIHLFQDGAVNIYSGQRYASDAQVAACVATFKHRVPDGTVHLAEGNIGVALNYERAENFLFETLGAEAAIFLEDDLILGQGYTRILCEMIDYALRHPAVGMVSAYGRSPATPIAVQRAREARVDHMGHNWGFGLTRAHWIERRGPLEPYMDLIRAIDYRDRSSARIAEWRESLGAGPEPTSQDDCKNLVSLRMGILRLATYANFGVYIGKSGLHMHEDEFVRAGYHLPRHIPYHGIPLRFPTDAEMSDILFCEVTARNLPNLGRTQQRRLDGSLVRAAYRLFLGREPECDRIVTEKLALEFPICLIHDLLTSPEYRDRELGPLDLSALVLNRRAARDLRIESADGETVDRDTLIAAARLFLTEEEAIQNIATQHFQSTLEILIALFGSREIRELYATALGTPNYFLANASSGEPARLPPSAFPTRPAAALG